MHTFGVENTTFQKLYEKREKSYREDEEENVFVSNVSVSLILHRMKIKSCISQNSYERFEYFSQGLV